MIIPRFKSDDQELTATSDYQQILELLTHLWEGGIVQRGRGYCISMADMVHTLLKQKGIKSRIVECKLTVIGIDPPGILLVGHDGMSQRQQDATDIDTHVVCITETDIPMLIDISVIGVRPDIPWIFERVNTGDENTIAEYKFNTSTWIYQPKPTTRLPKQMQKSIVDRIKTDSEIFRKFKTLTILIVIALTISLINAVRGAYDFYQVYIEDSNHWGPRQMHDLNRKLENLEQQIKKTVDQR